MKEILSFITQDLVILKWNFNDDIFRHVNSTVHIQQDMDIFRNDIILLYCNEWKIIYVWHRVVSSSTHEASEGYLMVKF